MLTLGILSAFPVLSGVALLILLSRGTKRSENVMLEVSRPFVERDNGRKRQEADEAEEACACDKEDDGVCICGDFIVLSDMPATDDVNRVLAQ